MFFQNSLADRSVGEDPGNKSEGLENKYSIPKELGRTGNKKGIQRAWSQVTREGWGQNFILTFQETKFYTKEIIWNWREIGPRGDTLRNWKRENKQLWNIHNFSEDRNKRMIFYRERIVISPKFSLQNNVLWEPARVAHLVSAGPSMCEVPTPIPVSTSLPF